MSVLAVTHQLVCRTQLGGDCVFVNRENTKSLRGQKTFFGVATMFFER